MSLQLFHWLDRKPFATQIILLSLVFDSIGAATGYLLHPYLGVEPLIGILYGLVAGSLPLSLWILRYQQQHG
ncbi:hypothetical protein [Natronocalculus amylovorans]|uniref:DUF8141 domain-containing protein n=1 Tax=Natronocalculus amylovorans TaxID=2917812 RepID=A0AAE3KA61_9EURY|nr:hypothetical protein [Natronocalculus amylovorans]MCL9818125.1 hypothetical protein [Natronocalculus amylovorans]NUE03845.1 hypothetical protein [Halorubraceae archaeon YAN]